MCKKHETQAQPLEILKHVCVYNQPSEAIPVLGFDDVSPLSKALLCVLYICDYVRVQSGGPVGSFPAQKKGNNKDQKKQQRDSKAQLYSHTQSQPTFGLRVLVL